MTCKRKFSLNLSKIKRELNDSTQADHLSISFFILDLIGYHILFWLKRKNNYQRKWWIKNYNHNMLLCIVNITKIPPLSTYTVKELIVHWKAVMKSKTTKMLTMFYINPHHNNKCTRTENSTCTGHNTLWFSFSPLAGFVCEWKRGTLVPEWSGGRSSPLVPGFPGLPP